MKRLIIGCLVLISLIGVGCKKSSLPSDIPACIKMHIQANMNNPDWEIGSVEEYAFQGKLVYAFHPDTRRIADAATTIQTSDCNNLCFVGGFGGPAVNLCNGENFFQKSVLKRKIWVKP